MNPSNEYIAVIFTSMHSGKGIEAYSSISDRMVEIASKQGRYLGIEGSRDENGMGITVSYWKSEESIRKWKENSEHLEAQKLGGEKWYKNFSLRIARVIREYYSAPDAEHGSGDIGERRTTL